MQGVWVGGVETGQEGTQRGSEALAIPSWCSLGVPVFGGHLRSPETPILSPQGTNYRKTNPALEIHRTRRDNFWAQAEVGGTGAHGWAQELGAVPWHPQHWSHGCWLGAWGC